MSVLQLQFNTLWVLLLLPLALLPWLSRNNEKVIVWDKFIPVDPLSNIIRNIIRTLASLAIASLLIGLAGPYLPQQQVEKIVQGAEFVILLDRSRSMDEPFAVKDRAQLVNHDLSVSKRTIATKYLVDFVENRRNDRFGFVFFSKRSITLLSLTENTSAILAVIKASAMGKGISETYLAQALIRSAELYSKQHYRGSRVVILVSDGGEKLTQDEKKIISSLFKKQKLSLYWIYLRSVDGMTLEEKEGESEQWKDRPERKLHQFFTELSVPYQVFEAGSHEQFSDAFSDINQDQLLPLKLNKTIAKQPKTTRFYSIAFLAILILASIQLYTLWGIRKTQQQRVAE